MSRVPRFLTLASVTSTMALLVALLGLSPVASAGTTTLTYPECVESLQVCMDASDPGDTILIATNEPIVEEICIPHGLRVEAAEGFDPVFGAEEGASPSFGACYIPSTGTHEMIVKGIRFVRTELALLFNGGSDHRVFLINNEFDRANIRVQAIGDGTFEGVSISDSTFDEGHVAVNSAPFGFIQVQRNHFFATNPLQASGAIDIRPSGETANETIIANNLIHDMGGCICGSNGGIQVIGTAATTSYILNNTVDSFIVPEDYSATGIRLSGEDSRAYLYNNTVSNTSGGIAIDSQVTAEGSGNNTYKTKGNSLSQEPVEVTKEPPEFMDAAGDDYRLKTGSFLRDHGTACVPAMPLPRADHNGNFRFAGKTVDIGALEKGSTIEGAVHGESFVGNGSSNTFEGTPDVDVICGMGGPDTLLGALGDDYIFGGTGGDEVKGAGGADRLHGDKGSDEVNGGGSGDGLYLKDEVQGNDSGNGGEGDDSCTADPGDILSSC